MVDHLAQSGERAEPHRIAVHLDAAQLLDRRDVDDELRRQDVFFQPLQEIGAARHHLGAAVALERLRRTAERPGLEIEQRAHGPSRATSSIAWTMFA